MKKSLMMMLLAACVLVGCGGKKESQEGTAAGFRNDVSTQTIVETVASELGDDYWPDMEITPEYLSDIYGISEDMYEEAYAQMPMISTNVDTLIVVKAAEDTVEDVQNALNTYKEAMVQDTFQYPVNIPKIQASEIATYGNYVCFVQLGADMGGEMDDEEVMITACQDMNARALEVIRGELAE